MRAPVLVDRRAGHRDRPGHAGLRVAAADDGARGTVFSPAAFRYVDVIIGAVAAASLLTFATRRRPRPRRGRPARRRPADLRGRPCGRRRRAARPRAAHAARPGRRPRHRGAPPAGRARRGDLMPIVVDIDVMLARRKMSVGTLADRVGITPANLAVLKNGRAKAVRFTTLAALCEVLDCQPGDLLRWEPDPEPAEREVTAVERLDDVLAVGERDPVALELDAGPGGACRRAPGSGRSPAGGPSPRAVAGAPGRRSRRRGCAGARRRSRTRAWRSPRPASCSGSPLDGVVHVGSGERRRRRCRPSRPDRPPTPARLSPTRPPANMLPVWPRGMNWPAAVTSSGTPSSRSAVSTISTICSSAMTTPSDRPPARSR